MDQLLLSRLDKDEQVTRLDNLSPQKFGRGAFARLSYTPSKLANNVLYKDAMQLKKTEENGSKIRQFQALNQILKGKLKHLQLEKEGIEQSLTQQIVMYKKMIVEVEEAQEQRLHDLQYGFNEEIQKIIQDKEEEAKYVQSQKQMMENRIYELEQIIGSLKEELNNRAIALQRSAQELEKLNIQHTNANQKVEQLGKQLKETNQNARKDIEELNQRINNQEEMYKATIEKLNLEKLRQIQNVSRLHQAEINKLSNQNQKQLMAKHQEIKDLKAQIQAATIRFNQTIAQKDQYIQTLSQNLNDEKEKLLQITKQYTVEIANLCNQKKQVEQECQTFLRSFQKEKEETKRLKATSSQTTGFLEKEIQKLKKDLELTHLDMLKQRERFYLEKDQLKRQLLILRKNAEQNGRLIDQNSILCKEVKNLKALLMESSIEMERCKDQFVRLGAQKEAVIAKLRELDIENEALHRLNVQREQEARAWRQSYYKYRK